MISSFKYEPRFELARLKEPVSGFGVDDDLLFENDIVPRARRTGRLTRADINAIRVWKWPPSVGRPSTDTDDFVEAVTALALSTPNERLRIEALTLLNGVGWPVASVILHFVHPDRYPILDRRALWSLGNDEPSLYHFAYWNDYTQCCRRLADEHGLTMRQLDRALWALAETKP
jgi:hypothetical protein